MPRFPIDQPINISVQTGQSSSAPEQKKRKLTFGKKPDVPFRRKVTETPGLINFYDLGQVKVADVWTDINFSIAPTFDSGGPNPFDHFPFSAANWTTLKNLIFAADPSTWKDVYRKLEFAEAEKYGLDLQNIDTGDTYPAARNGSRFDGNGNPIVATKWTEEGLKLDSVFPNFFVFSYGAFALSSNDPAAYKITNLPSYASPSVSFTLGKSADFFLLPRITNVVASSSNGLGDSDAIVGRYQPYKRSFWLNRTYEGSGFPIFSPPNGADFKAVDKTALITYLKTGADYYNSITGYNPNPAAFPAYASGGISFESATNEAPPINFYEGTFVGAIKQDNKMYYFWSKIESTIYVQGRDIFFP